MLGIIIAFIVGGMFGFAAMCCCVVAGKGERMIENDKADIS